MSNTNENILKSLAVLEQNLKDIHSAKEQVIQVVKSSEDLAKIIDSCKSSFEGLSVNVQNVLKESRDFNLDTITKLSEQTESFKKEVTRLVEFDFMKSFQSMETEVIKQFEKDLLARLVALDKKEQDLQVKIDEFKAQISRIESIDLERHFNGHQSNLLQISGKIKALNQTVSDIIQQYLMTINQRLINQTNATVANHNEITSRLIQLDNLLKDLKNITEANHNEITPRLHQLDNLQRTNQSNHKETLREFAELRKSLKINRIIQVCGIIIIILTIISGLIWLKF